MDLYRELRNVQKTPHNWDYEIDNDPVFDPPANESCEWQTGNAESESNLDSAWLVNNCTTIASNHHQYGLSGTELAQSVIDHLKSGDDAAVQMSLVELLGYDQLEFVSQILTKRKSLTSQKPGLSEAQRQEWRRLNRLKAAKQASNLVWQDSISPQLPHVYCQNKEKTALELVNVGRVLPNGAIRTSMPTYEHVVIPAQACKNKFEPVLLKISDLDYECQVTFSKYTNLNKMQSLAFPICYENNENMLICAPTGAGKTDVALLCCLNVIKTSIKSNETWKIVYVAPLKALAAEITEKLSNKLAWLGVKVRELTGDMQLSRSEISETHILVTTPEKWDVVTRKPNDDSGLASQLKLLIIDEVHLLHEERGTVLESIVARTRRQVESQQRPIRIVGLSATLPNFVDVAEFLGVNPQRGLFFFDQTFRPVPLEQQFFGIKGSENPHVFSKNLDRVVYDECVKQLRLGHSVMVFVHSRRETTKTAQTMITMAQKDGFGSLFIGENSEKYSREMRHFNHRGMHELYQAGFATHHAGMARSERNMSEKLFSGGGVRVLCTTATLAWGVNLPAAVVIIKGTQVYNSQHGGFVDLGISDVIQIFGRAGRPQFEQTGIGILCTGSDKLDHYLDAITNQHPIESRFASRLPEHLNAEIALGTVSTIGEACKWLSYTYMFVRMHKSPHVYGLLPKDLDNDPELMETRRKLVLNAARILRDTQMVIFDEADEGESLISSDIGRIASEFYLLRSTVEQFNNIMTLNASEQQIIQLLSKSEDFSGLKVRPDEVKELDKIIKSIPFEVDLSSSHGKTSLLLQSWIGRLKFQDTALESDMAYVAQNSARIIRAFFLLCVSRGWSEAANAALTLDKSLSQRIWSHSKHPLLQLAVKSIPPSSVEHHLNSSMVRIEDLKTFSSKELGNLVHNYGWGSRLAQLIAKFPLPSILVAQARPLTAKVIQLHIELQLLQPFKFDNSIHGSVLHFYLFVHAGGQLLHFDKMEVINHNASDVRKFELVVPYQSTQSSVIVQITSDAYIGAENIATIDFSRLKLPTTTSLRTSLLKLRPLGVHAWKNPFLEKHYGTKFQYFNPMQTMVFHSLYHTNGSVLLGSPTGSGKTIACEIAIWAALRDHPDSKIVYIAPMKALVRERVSDWRSGICHIPFLSGKKCPKLVEMTGDTQPTSEDISSANIIITTPEKFDGVSRNFQWATRDVSLVVMDEVHLLASDRGAILEVIVSRLNRNRSSDKTRLLGLSTSVANAIDLASWIGVKNNSGAFNFPSSVRPVPLEMYIYGFADVQGGFCPLMKSMNKPTYLAIKKHSPSKPVIVFVASRRQTRLTALDLISLCAAENLENVKRWLRTNDSELEEILLKIKDETLRHTLQFGVAIHHAGLELSDRNISHELFASGKVQVLVATSTLAWGINLPAYLVIIKGTQYFDAKINKYKDMDTTDVLQMMGRAGRPAFDTSGVAIIFTKQRTKQFYKYFLNLGFPVESSLHKANVLENHLGAEISSGRVKSLNEALEFLTHTFLFRRLFSNPSYYIDPETITDQKELNASGEMDGDESENCRENESNSNSEKGVDSRFNAENNEIKAKKWLIERVRTAFTELQQSQCLLPSATDIQLKATPFLRIASFYYISHLTMRVFLARIYGESSPEKVLQCIALAAEYDELAIRHNEDLLNIELSKMVEYPGENLGLRMVDPHVKAFLLFQARMGRVSLPIEDYVQDTITVLDQSLRIFQALIDTAAQVNNISLVVTAIRVLRSVKQGLRINESMLKLLPGVKKYDTNLKLQELTSDDAPKLGITGRHRELFNQSIAQIPFVKIDGTKAIINPLKRYVFCPTFHRPQRESWFVIAYRDNRILSMERVQRSKIVEAKSGEQILIMNDTCEVDYTIHSH